jgi:WD40 repeat protein
MQIKGHNLKVRAIEWFPNDEGLCTAAMDGCVYFYDLITHDELASNRNLQHDFHQKGCGFTGMCLMPNQPYSAIAVGSDSNIWYAQPDPSPIKVENTMSQVQMMANSKAYFTGYGVEGHPGMI